MKSVLENGCRVSDYPPLRKLQYCAVVEQIVMLFFQVYQRLADFGFEVTKLHNAIISCDLDYDKTLDNLIK